MLFTIKNVDFKDISNFISTIFIDFDISLMIFFTNKNPQLSLKPLSVKKLKFYSE